MKNIIIALVILLSACGGGDHAPQADQPPPVTNLPRFQNVDNYTAIDNTTGLAWDRYGTALPVTWDNALTYCIDFGTGWRLPSPVEFQNLSYDSELAEWNTDWPLALDVGVFNMPPAAAVNTTYLWADSPPVNDTTAGLIYNHNSRILSSATLHGSPLELNAFCVHD